jgi:hypothetical protein
VKVEDRASAKVEVYGDATPERVFAIQTSAIAFQTLSSKLYNDPVTAVIRELSCNAHDAHVEVGKKSKPFLLNLPTRLHPEFCIRDFGPGLSDDDLVDLYCTYFASSKRRTNKVIGGFGIGSKSPFSYTDGFTVVSYQKGEKRTYTAYINSDKVPAVTRLSTEQTTEEDGLEVKFPVKATDIYLFEEKARTVLEFFNPVPKINRGEFLVPKQTYLLEGKKWKLRKGGDYSGVRVIQGLVKYPVREQDLSGEKLTQQEQTILGCSIDIFVPIGSLSPAANRENLTTDKQTISRLRGLLNDAYTEMETLVEEKLVNFSTGWDKLMYLRNMQNDSALGKMVGAVRSKLLNDTNLFGDKIIRQSDYTELLMYKYSNDYDTVIRSDFFSKDYTREYSLADFDGTLMGQNVEFIVVDRSFGGDRNVRDYVRQFAHRGGYKAFVVFPKYPKQKADEFDMAGYLAQADSLFTAMGNPTVARLSGLSIPTQPKSASSSTAQSYKSWPYDKRASSYMNLWPPSKEAHPKSGSHFYVYTYRGRIKGMDNCEVDTIHSLINRVRTSELFPAFGEDTVLYALAEKDPMPNTRLGVRWISFLDYVESCITAYLTDPGNAAKLKMYDNLDSLSWTCDLYTFKNRKDDLKLSPDSLYLQALTLIRSNDLQPFSHGLLRSIAISMGNFKLRDTIDVCFVRDKTTANEVRNKVLTTYPLLKDGSRNDELSLYYIRTVDEQKQQKKPSRMIQLPGEGE